MSGNFDQFRSIAGNQQRMNHEHSVRTSSGCTKWHTSCPSQVEQGGAGCQLAVAFDSPHDTAQRDLLLFLSTWLDDKSGLVALVIKELAQCDNKSHEAFQSQVATLSRCQRASRPSELCRHHEHYQRLDLAHDYHSMLGAMHALNAPACTSSSKSHALRRERQTSELGPASADVGRNRNWNAELSSKDRFESNQTTGEFEKAKWAPAIPARCALYEFGDDECRASCSASMPSGATAGADGALL